MMKKIVSLLLAGTVFAACNSGLQKEVQTYLDEYNKKYQELSTLSNEAQWASNTKIVEGDSTNDIATRKTGEAFAAHRYH